MALRTSEIGTRMVPGAERVGVIGMVLGGAMLRTALGLGIGIPTILFCVRFVESQFYEATGVDTPVLLMSVLTRVGAALLGRTDPARRRPQPIRRGALRIE